MTEQRMGGYHWRQHLADACQATRTIRREVEQLSRMNNTAESTKHLLIISLQTSALTDALAALSSIGQAVRQ